MKTTLNVTVSGMDNSRLIELAARHHCTVSQLIHRLIRRELRNDDYVWNTVAANQLQPSVQ